MQKPKVKICCIASIAEAMLSINAGAAAVGLVGLMPSGPGVITNTQIASIVRNIPPSIDSFLLTSETSAKAIIEHHQLVQTTTIQMVDALHEGTYDQIRQALPEVKLVQVIHVLNQQSVEEALRIAPQVDFLLLDSGNPNLAVKKLGGTGKTHDWTLSQQIVTQSEVPVFLAGGLKASNVSAAIQQVQPYGLDLCSGVRTDGRLDGEKLAAFFNAVHGAEIN
ncbi:MAG: phosphoribosylanthranilate isomerase [Bacteroidota bacterium]